MAVKTWYVNPATRAKVTVVAGTAATDINVITQDDNGTYSSKRFKKVGATISAAEVAAVVQDAGAVPAVKSVDKASGAQGTIAPVAATAGAAYTQAEATSHAVAINAIIAALKVNGTIS